MGWIEINMEEQRLNFIQCVINDKETMSNACAQFGISRKTGYKWLNRFELDGLKGLKELSRAPHSNSRKLSNEMIEAIISIKQEFDTWGPKKIRVELITLYPDIVIPSESSIGNVLQNHHLSQPRRLRRHVARTSPLSHCEAPNDIWMYDFKGWFITGDGKKCEPLTITDGYSRYLLKCISLPRKNTQCVWDVFKVAFQEYGLPKKVRSDNGPPFASTGVGRLSPLAIKFIKAGVIPEWIEPGKPQQNGRHERFHLTLKKETASPPALTLRAQELLFQQFQHYYNDRRPHESLGQNTPKSVYQPSSRIWDGKLKSPEYTEEHDVRKVMKCGCISWLGKDFFLSESLYGEHVGIAEKDGDVMEVYYGPIKLGQIDLRKGFKRK